MITTKQNLRINQAVILAGGLGTRLGPYTVRTPKPMIQFFGKPFLEYVIEILRENNITRIVILVGYLHKKIEKYFGNGKKYGVSITYSYSPVESDTGTRIGNALHFLDDYFLLLYGDTIWPLNIDQHVKTYKRLKKPVMVTIYRNRDKATKNNIVVNKNGIVTGYDRSRTLPNLSGVDIGFFIINKRTLNNLPVNNFSFEDVVIPRLVKYSQLAGFFTDQKYYGLSYPDRIPSIRKYLSSKKVIFLDRDGVINKRAPQAQYIRNWREFVFLPGAIEGLSLLTKKKYKLFIITNQPGIAQGIMKKEDLDDIHKKLLYTLKHHRIVIEDIYICPHGWKDGCFCRKPNPGMFFEASYEHGINLTRSICIGDDERDIMAGKRAALRSIYFVGDLKHKFSKQYKPDKIYSSLYDAARHV